MAKLNKYGNVTAALGVFRAMIAIRIAKKGLINDGKNRS